MKMGFKMILSSFSRGNCIEYPVRSRMLGLIIFKSVTKFSD